MHTATTTAARAQGRQEARHERRSGRSPGWGSLPPLPGREPCAVRGRVMRLCTSCIDPPRSRERQTREHERTSSIPPHLQQPAPRSLGHAISGFAFVAHDARKGAGSRKRRQEGRRRGQQQEEAGGRAHAGLFCWSGGRRGGIEGCRQARSVLRLCSPVAARALRALRYCSRTVHPAVPDDLRFPRVASLVWCYQ